jgi:transposase
MRYGTRTHCKRRWTRQGRRPVCQVKLGYEWGYLYAAICPFDGDGFAMFFSHLDKSCFAVFLEQLQVHLQQQGKEKVLLIGDGATAHTAQNWQVCGLDWQRLPTACPELNPVERFFQELRKSTANRVFDNKLQIEVLLSKRMTVYLSQPQQIQQLTLFPYMIKSA